MASPLFNPAVSATGRRVSSRSPPASAFNSYQVTPPQTTRPTSTRSPPSQTPVVSGSNGKKQSMMAFGMEMFNKQFLNGNMAPKKQGTYGGTIFLYQK